MWEPVQWLYPVVMVLVSLWQWLAPSCVYGLHILRNDSVRAEHPPESCQGRCALRNNASGRHLPQRQDLFSAPQQSIKHHRRTSNINHQPTTMPIIHFLAPLRRPHLKILQVAQQLSTEAVINRRKRPLILKEPGRQRTQIAVILKRRNRKDAKKK